MVRGLQRVPISLLAVWCGGAMGPVRMESGSAACRLELPVGRAGGDEEERLGDRILVWSPDSPAGKIVWTVFSTLGHRSDHSARAPGDRLRDPFARCFGPHGCGRDIWQAGHEQREHALARPRPGWAHCIAVVRFDLMCMDTLSSRGASLRRSVTDGPPHALGPASEAAERILAFVRGRCVALPERVVHAACGGRAAQCDGSVGDEGYPVARNWARGLV